MKLKPLVICVIASLLTACASGDYYGSSQMSDDDTGATVANQQNMSYSQNDPSSQYRMGMRYLLGQGTQVDYSRAYSLLSSAAQQNNPYAANELGYMYLSGLGVPQDYQKAREWYERAASLGVTTAKYNLARLQEQGLGGPTDKKKAKELLSKASAEGFGTENSAAV